MGRISHYIIHAVSLLLIVILASVAVRQCSQKKDAARKLARLERDYIELLKAKQRVDTLYKEGKTQYVTHTEIKTVVDTLFIENGKVYSRYIDTISKPDIKLRAEIVASDLRSIDYQYSVTEKVIHTSTIVYDTIIKPVRRRTLHVTADIGQSGYSAGLQYQSRTRWGGLVRYESDKSIRAGVVFRVW